MKMDELSDVNHRLQAALGKRDRDLEAQMTELNNKEDGLRKRLKQLDKKKFEIAQVDGNVSAADDDLIEVNAGGKIIAAKRSTLIQLRGTMLEALFSGRWDKKLQRDGHGHVFLDVNPVGFEAIVDYLNEMAISSEDNPPDPPRVGNEHKDILRHQLELFGLSDQPSIEMPDSNIVKEEGHVTQLHDWLKEDGSDGDFHLLYRNSRDGDSAFHSKCDNQGCTLMVVETTCGFVLGGYSNTAWKDNRSWAVANRAFLFVLSGSDISSPRKMRLKNANNCDAVYHSSSDLPVFGRGHDLFADGTDVHLNFGNSYESGPSGRLATKNNRCYTRLAIKEMEVFQVSGAPSHAAIPTAKKRKVESQTPQVTPVTIFSEGVNEALNAKQASLLQAESEMLHLEDSFKDELDFVTTFASGETKDVIVLNVSGTIMATKRSTLCAAEDSVLAQQFDDTKWTEQGCNALQVKKWTPDDVQVWAESIEGIQEDVGRFFKGNEINGCELIALNMEGLKILGIERAGTLCLLLKEIEMLKQARDTVTLIEHSAYCFGKILDYLRLKNLHSQGLGENPHLPTVDDSQKSRFEKLAKYYFPGDSVKFILG